MPHFRPVCPGPAAGVSSMARSPFDSAQDTRWVAVGFQVRQATRPVYAEQLKESANCEIRNSKTNPKPEIRMLQTNDPHGCVPGANLEPSDFRACFEFRASSFGLASPLGPWGRRRV